LAGSRTENEGIPRKSPFSSAARVSLGQQKRARRSRLARGNANSSATSDPDARHFNQPLDLASAAQFSLQQQRRSDVQKRDQRLHQRHACHRPRTPRAARRPPPAPSVLAPGGHKKQSIHQRHTVVLLSARRAEHKRGPKPCQTHAPPGSSRMIVDAPLFRIHEATRIRVDQIHHSCSSVDMLPSMPPNAL
ncbi:unnamed protein product, partial [Ixodes persulcatus]